MVATTAEGGEEGGRINIKAEVPVEGGGGPGVFAWSAVRLAEGGVALFGGSLSRYKAGNAVKPSPWSAWRIGGPKYGGQPVWVRRYISATHLRPSWDFLPQCSLQSGLVANMIRRAYLV